MANSRIVDHPIVFASEGFCSLTGFSRYELLQRPGSLSAMHGELTTQESKEKLARLLEGEAADVVEMLIYKKNGERESLSCFVLFCLAVSCFVLLCLVLSGCVLFCLVLSGFVLLCLVLSCFVWLCLVLSCIVLFCFDLFCI